VIKSFPKVKLPLQLATHKRKRAILAIGQILVHKFPNWLALFCIPNINPLAFDGVLKNLDRKTL